MAVLIFFIGAIMGSFYLVIGTRLPKGENALINAKIPNSSLDKITVKYKLFDFESRYNIKIK